MFSKVLDKMMMKKKELDIFIRSCWKVSGLLELSGMERAVLGMEESLRWDLGG